MANEKNLNARFQQKHDIEFNWLKATGFTPKEGELVVYDAETASTPLPSDRAQPINYPRIKIGDGKTNVNNLPFITYTPEKGVDYWTEADKAEIKSYVDEAILGGAW